LCVFCGVFDYFTEDATSGVDLFDRQFSAILEVGTGCCTGARQFNNVRKLNCICRLDECHATEQGCPYEGFQNKTFFHHYFPVVLVDRAVDSLC
jgi:hypothetical protein